MTGGGIGQFASGARVRQKLTMRRSVGRGVKGRECVLDTVTVT